MDVLGVEFVSNKVALKTLKRETAYFEAIFASRGSKTVENHLLQQNPSKIAQKILVITFDQRVHLA